MSDDNFFSRWSRRKQEAVKPAAPPASGSASHQRGDEAPPTGKGATLPAAERTPEPSEPIIDLSKLPSLDSIGPTTDIRPFLQPGVPASLSRAALRRMWSADPAIRDYVGLSENAWDFTAPDSMPGFGPLLPTDDVKRLLAQVFGEDRPGNSPVQAEASGSAERSAEETHDAPPQQLTDAGPVTNELKSAEFAEREKEILHRSDDDVATQKDVVGEESAAAPIRRRHGGALPT